MGEPLPDGGQAVEDDPAELGLDEDDEPEPTPPGHLKDGTTPDDAQGDAAPPEDAKRAQADDAFVPRDENDEVPEVEKFVTGFGTAVMRPMVYGELERHLGDAGSVAEAGPDAVASIMRARVLEPDFETYARENFREFVERQSRGNGDEGPPPYLTGDVVRHRMSPFAPQAYLKAVLEVSGVDASVAVNEDGSATVEFGEGDEAGE